MVQDDVGDHFGAIFLFYEVAVLEADPFEKEIACKLQTSK